MTAYVSIGWAKVLVTSSDCSVQRRLERNFTCKHVKSSESLIYIILVISIDGSSVSRVVSIRPVLCPSTLGTCLTDILRIVSKK